MKEEIKEKISKALKGRETSVEHRKNLMSKLSSQKNTNRI